MDVTEETFATAVIERSKQVPVVVDFWAEWCGPCRMLAPVLDQIATEYAGKLRVVKLDVDANPVVASRFGIQGIPTMILFKGGQPQAQLVGARPKGDILREVDRVL
jgi:thioredoxin 1